MKVPLESYLEGRALKVYSLVAEIPFSPVDLDLNLLAKGHWDPSQDRFRLWHLPSEAQADKCCYVTMRKVDRKQGILVYVHIVVNLEPRRESGGFESNFTVGVLSNEEARAASVLESILEVPPVFHTLSEVKLVESKWRADGASVAQYSANVVSALAHRAPEKEDQVTKLDLEIPPEVFAQIRPGMGSWWEDRRAPDGGAGHQNP